MNENQSDNLKGTGESADSLTNRQGHPVTDNQNIRTVGNRGPSTLENYDFIEKISHFDRERVPERVVHARGAGAHGYFEAYGKAGDEPIAKYTRAKLFQEAGNRTPVFVRFPLWQVQRNLRKPHVIQEALRLNFIQRMGIGILLGII